MFTESENKTETKTIRKRNANKQSLIEFKKTRDNVNYIVR